MASVRAETVIVITKQAFHVLTSAKKGGPSFPAPCPKRGIAGCVAKDWPAKKLILV